MRKGALTTTTAEGVARSLDACDCFVLRAARATADNESSQVIDMCVEEITFERFMGFMTKPEGMLATAVPTILAGKA
jgi:hypothetical protein